MSDAVTDGDSSFLNFGGSSAAAVGLHGDGLRSVKSTSAHGLLQHRLDAMGFVPFARVIQGDKVLDALHHEYGEAQWEHDSWNAEAPKGRRDGPRR